MCGADAKKGDPHTGLCLLEHFISYTGTGKHGFDLVEFRRIVSIIVKEMGDREEIKKEKWLEVWKTVASDPRVTDDSVPGRWANRMLDDFEKRFDTRHNK